MIQWMLKKKKTKFQFLNFILFFNLHQFCLTFEVQKVKDFMFFSKTPIASLMFFFFFHRVDLHPHIVAFIYNNWKKLTLNEKYVK
jgi:hypothetical protein